MREAWSRCAQCFQALLNGRHPDGSMCSLRRQPRASLALRYAAHPGYRQEWKP